MVLQHLIDGFAFTWKETCSFLKDVAAQLVWHQLSLREHSNLRYIPSSADFQPLTNWLILDTLFL